MWVASVMRKTVVMRVSRARAVRCSRTTAGAVLLTSGLPVWPDPRRDLDVGEVGKLVGEGKGVGAVALGITLG